MNLYCICLCLLLPASCFGDVFILGAFDLAGLVPPALPAAGETLTMDIQEVCDDIGSIALRSGTEVVGYIPARFHIQIREMQLRGLHLEVRVVRQHPVPSPGAYLEVELWATSQDIRLLIPLVEPAEEDAEPIAEWE